jgi:hypothetical protein
MPRQALQAALPPGGSPRPAKNPPGVRNGTLHRTLEAFTVEASGRLSADIAGGAEMPFELVERRGGTAALYCYRPLTTEFVAQRLATLEPLSTYGPAVAALAECEGIGEYLTEQGVARVPSDPHLRMGLSIAVFLGCVFEDRSEFGFEPAHFEAAYSELERVLYQSRCIATVLAPVRGVALDPATSEIRLGDGLSLIRGDAVHDAPEDAVWGDGDECNVLAVLVVDQERSSRSPVSVARVRFRRVLTALRLFERGGYALGPMVFSRTEAGGWHSVPFGTSGRPRVATVIPAEQEDELRAFCELVARKAGGRGELGWALARFEMGCERLAPFEALTDYLLALRALLEPEGPSSGRLAHRLAVICATPEQRGALAERTARAVSLERAVITGLAATGSAAGVLVDELAEHLRAILRDVLCGHLGTDLCAMADELLADAAVSEPDAPETEPVG